MAKGTEKSGGVAAFTVDDVVAAVMLALDEREASDIAAAEQALEEMQAGDGDGGDEGGQFMPVSLENRARIINMMRSLSGGYAFHAGEPIGRCIDWVQSQPWSQHNAATLIVVSIGEAKPDLIGGSGWIAEAQDRLDMAARGVEAATGEAGLTGFQLGEAVEEMRLDKAFKAQEVAAEQNRADIAADEERRVELERSFNPDLGGEGVVRVIDDEEGEPETLEEFTR